MMIKGVVLGGSLLGCPWWGSLFMLLLTWCCDVLKGAHLPSKWAHFHMSFFYFNVGLFGLLSQKKKEMMFGLFNPLCLLLSD